MANLDLRCVVEEVFFFCNRKQLESKHTKNNKNSCAFDSLQVNITSQSVT